MANREKKGPVVNTTGPYHLKVTDSVIVLLKTVACPSKTVSSDTTLALPSKYSKSVRNRKIEAISRLKAKKE